MYIPLWLTVMGTVYAIRKVMALLRTLLPEEDCKVAEKLQYYPFILVISWILPTFQFIYCLIVQHNIDWLEDAAIITHCSQGLSYSLLFFNSVSMLASKSRDSGTTARLSTISKARGSTLDLTIDTIRHLETAG